MSAARVTCRSCGHLKPVPSTSEWIEHLHHAIMIEGILDPPSMCPACGANVRIARSTSAAQKLREATASLAAARVAIKGATFDAVERENLSAEARNVAAMLEAVQAAISRSDRAGRVVSIDRAAPLSTVRPRDPDLSVWIPQQADGKIGGAA